MQQLGRRLGLRKGKRGDDAPFLSAGLSTGDSGSAAAAAAAVSDAGADGRGTGKGNGKGGKLGKDHARRRDEDAAADAALLPAWDPAFPKLPKASDTAATASAVRAAAAAAATSPLSECFSLNWSDAFASGDADAETGLGIKFTEAEKPAVSVRLPYIEPLLLEQRIAVGLGAVVWDCGIALAHALCELTRGSGHEALDLSRCRVLDLGSGTGVVGLAAHQCGADFVDLVDVPEVLAVLAANAKANTAAGALPADKGNTAPLGRLASLVPKAMVHDSSQTVRVRKLKWGHATSAAYVAEAGVPDVVLCSDCLYEEKCFAAFRETLDVVAPSPRTLVLMAYKKRVSRQEQPFFDDLARSYEIGLAPQDLAPETMRGKGVYLCALRRRPMAGERVLGPRFGARGRRHGSGAGGGGASGSGGGADTLHGGAAASAGFGAAKGVARGGIDEAAEADAVEADEL